MTTPSYEEIVQKNILDLLELQDIPLEKKEKLFGTLAKTVENRVILRMDELLTVDEVDEWKQLVDAKDMVNANKYLKIHGVDLDRLAIEESALLKAELVFLLADVTPGATAAVGA